MSEQLKGTPLTVERSTPFYSPRILIAARVKQGQVAETGDFISPKWKNQRSWRANVDELLGGEDAAGDEFVAPKWKNQRSWKANVDDLLGEQDAADGFVAPKWKNQRSWRASADEMLAD